MQAAAEGQKLKRRGISRGLFGALFRSRMQRERDFYDRLRELNDALAGQPGATTARVLRGELYLERGELARAAADFESALRLMGALDGTRGWRIVEQAMRDRALLGLRMIGARDGADD